MKTSKWLPEICCEIPLSPYALKRRAWSFREQRLLWYQILTYVACPDDVKERRRVTLLLSFQALKRTHKGIRRRTESGKGTKNLAKQIHHIANLLSAAGGIIKLDMAPQRSDFEAALRSKLREMYTVRAVVSVFLRMYRHMNAGGPSPSLQKAKDILREADYHKTPVLRRDGNRLYSMHSKVTADSFTHFRKKDLIDQAWKRYASVSHLVYGILEAGEEVLFDRKEAAKTLPSILSKALYAQNVLLNFEVRETKRTTRDAGNLWRLPEGMVDVEENTLELPPLSEVELQALYNDRTKSRKDTRGNAAPTDILPDD